ncbi:MAG: type II/IV secretion system protein [Gemmatimonadaceae bacterium]|nr:type II/IV secretion system protein [Gemmatimonadaceae bacterium]
MQATSSQPITLADSISREYLVHHRVCPKAYSAEGTVIVAVAPNALLDAIDDIGFAYRCAVITEVTPEEEVERLIERLTNRTERSIELARVDGELDELTADVRDLANQVPVVRYVNLLVRDAYDAGASDIHLEATRSGLSARFRLDGVLAPAPEPPSEMHHAIVSRIKLLAELDIAERRRPQDGRIRVRLEARELDLRVSTVPTMYGESVVLRLLDRGGRPVGLEELGMPAGVLDTFTQIAKRPHGMVLVTGPTGSGKTTTLYAALQTRDRGAEKIVTVEEPIEYQLAGITQVPVHRQAGVTFGAALRSILRQDPDVIMVGEMRDAETAEIAVQAAMTGHLVFSTLHTNDAIGAVPRLLDLSIPDYLVAATLEAVLAQRLVRRICDECRIEYRPSAEHVATLSQRPVGMVTLTKGAGCASCRGTGFRGRVGLFELLVLDDMLKEAIVRSVSRVELRRLADGAGMHALQHDGWQKIEAGLTTVEEVLRVVQA